MTCFDPLRKKEVAATPEEKVRQWFICTLKDSAGVPLHMMMSEVSLSFGQKPLRADIVVYRRDLSPVAIVECKRPDVTLGPITAQQALLYHGVLGVNWIMLTNGKSTYIYKRNGDGFAAADHLPSWNEMTQ